MAPLRFMFIAGETSGDLLASELIAALRARRPSDTAEPSFFGAGGRRMNAAGVDVVLDLTQHAVIGIWEVLVNYIEFRRLFHQLVDVAVERRPDVIVCVDFSGFNRRFGHAIRRRQKSVDGWAPKIIQFVSPQVWASRPGRAVKMARDFDLLLSIFPFEKPWYEKHAPTMRVEFVGHPMLDRFTPTPLKDPATHCVLLLPGSRPGELRRHLPVMTAAAQLIREKHAVDFSLVVPGEELQAVAQELAQPLASLKLQVGGLAGALAESTIALASTGTVTMECAFFKVPTVTLYKTNWLTYEIGRRIVTVKSLTMPNI
ncbi:MAG TPA: lipid-A-disaccharide synthase, partial [Verrucomicrobiae bacterium]|nr:lipid-A-disaccharide synthase [Verrucomicrobiae bacterium]